MQTQARAEHRCEDQQPRDPRGACPGFSERQEHAEDAEHRARRDNDVAFLAEVAHRIRVLKLAVGEAQRDRVHQPQPGGVDSGVGHASGCKRLASERSAPSQLGRMAEQLAHLETRLSKSRQAHGVEPVIMSPTIRSSIL